VARAGAVVATETPELFIYYTRQAGRDDLRAVSLSDREAVGRLTTGDVIVVARGRRYFSNDAVTRRLSSDFPAAAVVRLAETESDRVYVLDEAMLAGLADALNR
jgi:uridylate kinase